MEITKETIFKNLIEALEYKDYYANDENKETLNKVIENHFDELSQWTFQDYLQFTFDVLSEGFINTLRQYDLITSNNLGLPSRVIIPLIELQNNENIDEAIEDWLSDKFGYFIDDYCSELDETSQTMIISEIDWIIS